MIFLDVRAWYQRICEYNIISAPLRFGFQLRLCCLPLTAALSRSRTGSVNCASVLHLCNLALFRGCLSSKGHVINLHETPRVQLPCIVRSDQLTNAGTDTIYPEVGRNDSKKFIAGNQIFSDHFLISRFLILVNGVAAGLYLKI